MTFASCVKRLKRRDGGRIHRQRERPAAFCAGYTHDAVREIDLIPTEVEEAAAAQARVDRQDDLLLEVGRRLDQACHLEETVVLLAAQVAKPRIVVVEQLHSAYGIGCREVTRDHTS